jgi:hypothetical protein
VRPPGGSEKFSSEATSVENEMSVIKYMTLCGDAPLVGLSLPEIDKFQVPHHGGRRNLSTEILDRWFGPPLDRPLPNGQERFTVAISSAKEDSDHPRKAVLRAMRHRGAFILTTEGKRSRCRNRPGRRLRAGASSWPIQLPQLWASHMRDAASNRGAFYSSAFAIILSLARERIAALGCHPVGENPKAFIDRGGLSRLEAEAAEVAVRRVREAAYPLIFKLFGGEMPGAEERKVVLDRLGKDLARIERNLGYRLRALEDDACEQARRGVQSGRKRVAPAKRK